VGWREVTAGLGTNLWWPVLLGVIVLQNPAPSDASEFCDTEVRVVTPGNPSAVAAMTAPSDAIVLFDGNNSAQWKGRDGDAKWDVHDGVLSVRKGTGDIETKRLFQDMQLHIEWRVPSDITGEEQFRGNSGVLMQGRYEIQVLDSYRNPTYADGQAGAIAENFSQRSSIPGACNRLNGNTFARMVVACPSWLVLRCSKARGKVLPSSST